MNLDAILPPVRQLRMAAVAREADRDDSESEYDARMAFVALAQAMNMHIDPERPPRWLGLADLARQLERAANTLAELRSSSFDQVGAVAALTLAFGAVASRMGYRAELIAHIDDAARVAVEGFGTAAE